ncbi:MAG: hypothetical protein IPH07_13135 [Deltaproteobacteria bacterium]|nr:hypothetical protein [Deltaproteobacteria bacterium]MBK8716982.1 hypothetical protein [Deltaproteobacteria bacterium]MBP7292476.1 hypothetical protein [Nannocystaceae bacterium]
MDSNGLESSKSVSSAGPAANESSRRTGPIIAGAAVVIAIVVAIIAWPRSDDSQTGAKRKGNAASRADDDKGTVAAAKGPAGGVAPRAYDEATPPSRSGRINPAVRLPSLGMAPDTTPRDEGPPTFKSTAEEIAWYEKKLEQAEKALEDRKTFYDRLPGMRERIEKGPDPARNLQTFEGRKKIVEENYAKAQADVLALERKLAELRGA